MRSRAGIASKAIRCSRSPAALGYRVRRLDRRFRDAYAIDLDRFGSLVTSHTRLAIVTNLHNPSGARIDAETQARMAAIMARARGLANVSKALDRMLNANG
jgi:aspartate/methionine/tyrosine aminotransferase